MYLTVTFGLDGPTRQVSWDQPVDKFPKLLRYGGKKWEWVAYDQDPTNKSAYVLLFSELPTYDPSYYVDMEDFEEKFFGYVAEGCSCGAIHSRSFPFDHMRYCVKHTKW
jgi:hypothetical protein